MPPREDRVQSLSAHERPPAPFIVGVGRSGTTLLRLMLDAHPALAIPAETHFIPDLVEAMTRQSPIADAVDFLEAHRRWQIFEIDPSALRERAETVGGAAAPAVIRAFFELYAESRGKPRWGDKTPPYVARMPIVARAVPEARFVHLIRDGRAVAVSLKNAYFGPDTAAAAAARWAHRIKLARQKSDRLSHYMEVRYEDLVTDPEPSLRSICEFLDLDWDGGVLDYHEHAGERIAHEARTIPRRDGKVVSADTRVGLHPNVGGEPTAARMNRWRDELSADELRAVEEAAGEMLAELGYDETG